MASKVLSCSCKSDFQDKEYGNHQRLHTVGKDFYTCTVCGNKKVVK